jgi:hypothetical protein
VERSQITQSMAALGTFVGELSGVGVDLGVRCPGQHPPGIVENDLSSKDDEGPIGQLRQLRRC